MEAIFRCDAKWKGKKSEKDVDKKKDGPKHRKTAAMMTEQIQRVGKINGGGISPNFGGVRWIDKMMRRGRG